MVKPLAESIDPFGLWQVTEQDNRAESFALPDEGDLPVAEKAQGMVWSLDLHSGVDAAEQLDQREQQVQAIEAGLDQAVIRAERTLLRYRAAAQGAPVSFGVDQPAAEADLSAALLAIDPGEAPISYGLELPQINWEQMKRRFDQFMEGVNRQVLHYAWVETKLDGAVMAQTAVRWGGDLNTYIVSGSGAQIAPTHTRSLTLALAARSANVRTAFTVMQIAAKIALAVSTPMGVVQALSLAWQFVYDVIMPLLEAARS